MGIPTIHDRNTELPDAHPERRDSDHGTGGCDEIHNLDLRSPGLLCPCPKCWEIGDLSQRGPFNIGPTLLVGERGWIIGGRYIAGDHSYAGFSQDIWGYRYLTTGQAAPSGRMQDDRGPQDAERADPINRISPLSCVGTTGFEPATP
ncbi:hypothetical protein GCM10023193_46340 [Planotetraspora kaengkrachanensis]|uniref:Uncharacterized protein n=1 Tax=Planotetraspora kaengkrachanensis TaxID=575193 RepID=A0A8J3PTP2_9ACTN|nr:hypothetical protein Pka01_37030 [Planotetraspora kaengkrachanensis]